MASKLYELNYADYVKLHHDDNIRERFTNQQWVALNKLVRQEELSVEDKRALRASGVLDKQNKFTLNGRVCVNKINKKRQSAKNKKKTIREKLAWETEND